MRVRRKRNNVRSSLSPTIPNPDGKSGRIEFMAADCAQARFSFLHTQGAIGFTSGPSTGGAFLAVGPTGDLAAAGVVAIRLRASVPPRKWGRAANRPPARTNACKIAVESIHPIPRRPVSKQNGFGPAGARFLGSKPACRTRPDTTATQPLLAATVLENRPALPSCGQPCRSQAENRQIKELEPISTSIHNDGSEQRSRPSGCRASSSPAPLHQVFCPVFSRRWLPWSLTPGLRDGLPGSPRALHNCAVVPRR